MIKIKAQLELNVPDNVAATLFKDQEDQTLVTRFSMPVYTQDENGRNITYHLEAPMVWEADDA